MGLWRGVSLPFPPAPLGDGSITQLLVGHAGFVALGEPAELDFDLRAYLDFGERGFHQAIIDGVGFRIERLDFGQTGRFDVNREDLVLGYQSLQAVGWLGLPMDPLVHG